MSEETVGQRLDVLGVKSSVEEGELVSDALVIMRVVDNEGGERLNIAWSEGLSWITRAGMLHHALTEETKDGDDE